VLYSCRIYIVRKRELVFAGMTSSVRFSDISDGSQSPSCNIILCGELPFECLYDLSRWNFLSDMQSNNTNSAIEIDDNSIDILRVKYMEGITVSWCAGLWLLSLVLIVNIVCILFMYLLSTFVVNKRYLIYLYIYDKL